MISVFDRVENIVEKEIVLITSVFFLFPQCFHKASFSKTLKVGDCVVKS